MLLHDFASRRPGHVHGDVAASDDNDLLADGELVTEVYVEQEVDALVHTVEVDAGNTEIAAAMSSYSDEDSVESVAAQFGDGEVAACGVIQLERDVARLENFAHLGFHYVTGQTVFRNAEIQHAAGNRRRFKNGYGIAH